MSRLEAEAQLTRLVKASPCLMQALCTARNLALPQWCIAAGAIRNLVWDDIHQFNSRPIEIDLIYWDDADSTSERDRNLAAQLQLQMPQIEWDVTNQAGVHLWYRDELGQGIAPFASTLAGMASWPETATAVGVSLNHADELIVWAPILAHGDNGLADLLALRLRHNAAQVSQAVFHQRIAEKQFFARWPQLQLC